MSEEPRTGAKVNLLKMVIEKSNCRKLMSEQAAITENKISNPGHQKLFTQSINASKAEVEHYLKSIQDPEVVKSIKGKYSICIFYY